MTPTLYGIRNCDTMARARAFLDAAGVEYRFHDYRIDGLDVALLARLTTALGWQNLLNRRGTSWRKLPESVREGMDATAATRVMLDNPAIIKRPVLEIEAGFELGFDPERWRAVLGGNDLTPGK